MPNILPGLKVATGRPNKSPVTRQNVSAGFIRNRNPTRIVQPPRQVVARPLDGAGKVQTVRLQVRKHFAIGIKQLTLLQLPVPVVLGEVDDTDICQLIEMPKTLAEKKAGGDVCHWQRITDEN